MHTVAGERIEEYRQGGNESLTLTGGHLGNLSLMQNHTTEELHVVMYHFPLEVVASGCPVVVIDGLVAVDGDEVLAWVASQFTVEVGGSDYGDLIGCESLCRLLDDGEHLRHSLVEFLLKDVEYFLLDFVNLCEDVGALVDGRLLYLCLEFLNLLALVGGRFLNMLSDLLCPGTEFVVVELLDLWRDGFHLLYEGLDELHVP